MFMDCMVFFHSSLLLILSFFVGVLVKQGSVPRREGVVVALLLASPAVGLFFAWGGYNVLLDWLWDGGWGRYGLNVLPVPTLSVWVLKGVVWDGPGLSHWHEGVHESSFCAYLQTHAHPKEWSVPGWFRDLLKARDHYMIPVAWVEEVGEKVVDEALEDLRF